jgi:hypothetical protein
MALPLGLGSWFVMTKLICQCGSCFIVVVQKTIRVTQFGRVEEYKQEWVSLNLCFKVIISKDSDPIHIMLVYMLFYSFLSVRVINQNFFTDLILLRLDTYQAD